VIEGESEHIINHVHTKDVAYASTPKARRAIAHAQALSWMEEVIGGRDEEFAEVLAYHADRSGDEPRTARYALLAGHRNRRVFAGPEAIRWYDRAMEAAEPAGRPTDRAVTAEIALSRGDARELLGQFAEVTTDYERAIEDATASEDGPLEARAMAALAHVYWLQDRFEQGRAILGQALERARSVGAAEVLVRLLYTAGTLDFGQGRFPEALAMHQEALRVALSAGDHAGEALARHGLCETLYFTGPIDQALEEGRRADELFRALGQRPMVYHNIYMVGFLLWMKGRVRESLDAFQEAVDGCREVGNRRDEGFALARSLVWISLGDLGKALADIDEGIGIAREIRTPRLELAARGMRIGLQVELGRWEGLGSEIESLLAMAEEMKTDFFRSRMLAWAGWLALRNGDRRGADSWFGRSREATGGILQDVLGNRWIEIMAMIEAGDEPRLRATAEELTEAAEGESPMYLALGRYGLAVAALLRQDWAQAFELATTLEETARSFGDRMIEWMAARLAWKALAGLERHWDAMVAVARAARISREIAETITDENLRRSFLSRPEVAEVLVTHGSWLFGDLTPEELDAVRSVSTVTEKRAGEVVFRRGDPGTAFFVIDRGTVAIVARSDSGTERTLATLGPGEAFGEVALLDGQPRTADAVAHADCRLIELPREEFLRLLAEQPSIAERLMTMLVDRARDGEAVAGNGFADIPARLAKAIQNVAEREGRAGAAIEILPVFVRDGTIRYIRGGAGSSLQISSAGSRHPNQAVVASLAKHDIAPRAVHSTSWRYDRGRLILTYLAVLDGAVKPPEGMDSVEVRRTDLARGSATGPPASIEIDSVVEHALRHLAWLLRDDPAIRSVLDDHWAAALSGYEPEPFRSLGQFEPVAE